MKKYEGKTFDFQGHRITILSVYEETASIKFATGAFQNVRYSDLEVIVQNGEEVPNDQCNFEEGCASCGS
tara:strand:- start:68 stop:277 length:210 start_codon:yes stop_codon:yes gene_type:complete